MTAATTKVKDVPLKGGGFEWVSVATDQWHGKVDAGKLPPRIRQLDAKTYCCYRDGKYLGSEASMAAAFERIKSNHQSDKNIALAIWQRAHPDELPPAMALTEAERAEWWRHNPPKGGAIKGPTQSRGEVLPPTGLVKVGGKVIGHSGTVIISPADPLTQKIVREQRATKETAGSRDGDIRTLLKRGCTSEEMLRMLGWKAISMPATAKRLGLALRIEKGVKPFRYFGTEK